MRTRAPAPVIVDVDMTVVREVLERVQATLSAEDHACLQGLVQTFIELSKLVRERGTTIARLRRLFGLACSEKTADVLGKCARTGDNKVAQDEPSSDGDASDAIVRDDCSDTAAATPPSGESRGGVADPAMDPDPVRKRVRKGHGRIGASEYPSAHHFCVEHESLRPGDVCPRCAQSKLYRLQDPARHMRIVGQPPLAADIWDCTRLRCGGCGLVFTARPPQQALGPKYDDSAVSMMALLRYGAGMPLHRLDRLQRNLGVPLPASTQWEVVRDRMPALMPVYNELRRVAAQGRVLHNDDTSMRILSLMGRRRAELLAKGELADPDRTGLFTTAIMSITDAGPVVLFFTGRKHAGENLAMLLAERDKALGPPIQMCDALDRNVAQGYVVLLSNCLAHGRRHIVDEVENFPEECQHVLEALRQVFHNESICRERDLSGQQRLELHQRQSGPVMDELETWLHSQLDEKRVEPNSGLGEAFRYLLKHWDKLTLFLRVPDAPIDNNIVERALKMAIRHRNNSRFYRSEQGARVGDVYMALIYTAELHGRNPFDYLFSLLTHEAEVAAAPAEWLPWNYTSALARASPASPVAAA
jgi:transposase